MMNLRTVAVIKLGVMRKLLHRSLLIGLCALCAQAYADDGWKTSKSDHFIVRYRTNDSFVDNVIRNAEMYYHTIERELELDRFDRFWTWDERCRIIIFENQTQYRQATRMPDWSGGCVDYKNRIIYTYPWSDDFITTLLPHELSHIIFREYVKNNPLVPLWLDEGIAQYHEQKTDSQADLFFANAVLNDMLLDINQLQAVDSITHDTSNPRVYLFYTQAKSLVSFMIDRYGHDRFAEFIRQLRSGKTVDGALRFAYPGTADSLENLEKKWRESLR